MSQPPLPQTGTCRCGAVEIEVSAQPLMTAACHCRGCQKMSASAFSLTAMIPSAGFKVTKGTPVKGGLQGPQLDHFCCPECKSWMFTRITGLPDFVNVRPTLFEDLSWATPFIETMTSAKLNWVNLPVEHSFDGFPPVEDYMALITAYSAAHTRA
ncbi:GFA family protein [Woodsholea maritima]|uniref:GFA family protein n=1 Tax=Woodsholea maritima TaxID=240237 RepID=UPI000375FDED|nr:GFA family protein [Woodsholea maritima]